MKFREVERNFLWKPVVFLATLGLLGYTDRHII